MSLAIITCWFGEQTVIPLAPTDFIIGCKCFFYTDNKNLQIYIENQGWEYRYMSTDKYNIFRVKLLQFTEKEYREEMNQYKKIIFLTLDEIENRDRLLILCQ